MKVFGWDLTIDLYGCNGRIKDDKSLRIWVDHICTALNMRKYGPCVVAHFGHEDDRTSGYTVYQLIESSNITGHFVDKYGVAFVNIFSCKKFEKDFVTFLTQDYFGAKSRKARMTERYL